MDQIPKWIKTSKMEPKRLTFQNQINGPQSSTVNGWKLQNESNSKIGQYSKNGSYS